MLAAFVVGIGGVQTAQALTSVEAEAIISALSLDGSKAATIRALVTKPTNQFDSPSTCYSFGKMIGIGATGRDVVELQSFLERTGFLVIPPGLAKGYFGTVTQGAVMKFQASLGLPTTGMLDDATAIKISAYCSQGGSTTTEGHVSLTSVKNSSDETNSVMYTVTSVKPFDKVVFVANCLASEIALNAKGGMDCGIANTIGFDARTQYSYPIDFTVKDGKSHTVGVTVYVYANGSLIGTDRDAITLSPKGSVDTKSFKVLSPQEGNVFSTNDNMTVRWTPYTGDFDFYYVFLENSINGMGSNVQPDIRISKNTTSVTYSIAEQVKQFVANANGKTAEDLKYGYSIGVSAEKINGDNSRTVATATTGKITITPSSVSGGSFNITSPNQETWKRGTLQKITWTSTNVSSDSKVYISLVREGAEEYYDVANVYNLPNNTGSFIWEVGKTPEGYSMDKNGSYWIRICNETRTVCNTSGGRVVVVGTIETTKSADTKVITPQGGETWNIGDKNTIRWEYPSALAGKNVGVYISLSNGDKAWNIYGEQNIGVANTAHPGGEVPWSNLNFSDITPGSYRIEFSFTDKDTYKNYHAYSNYFTVTRSTVAIPAPKSLSIISPNGGEVFQGGSGYYITYTNGSNTEKIRAELVNRTTGQTMVIAENITSSPSSLYGTGTILWSLPLNVIPGTNYKMRIVRQSDGSMIDESDQPFSIKKGYVAGEVGITSDKVEIASNDSINLSYSLPTDTVYAKLYISCPAGVSVKTFDGVAQNICNSLFSFTTLPQKPSVVTFSNIGESAQRVPINFYVYPSDNVDKATVVSKVITVKSSIIPNPSVTPTVSPSASPSPLSDTAALLNAMNAYLNR